MVVILEGMGHEIVASSAHISVVTEPLEEDALAEFGPLPGPWLVVNEQCVTRLGRCVLISRDYHLGSMFSFSVVRRREEDPGQSGSGLSGSEARCGQEYSERPGTIQVLEVDDPRCGEREVVIAVAQCGVCGTDRSIFRGEYAVTTPVILGHEYSGTVVEIGNEVVGFAVGDRVVVDPNVVDDTCFFCRRGLSHLCSGLSPLGVARSGGFAELSAVPARYLYKIPDGVSLSQAALIEPLACCIRGIDQASRLGG